MVGEMTPNWVVEIREEDVVQQSPDMKVGDGKKKSEPSNKKWEATDLIQWSLLVSLTGLLIATLAINKLRKTKIWEVELWRTCVFALVIFCGNIISRKLIDGLKILIVNSNHYLKSKFVYLIYVIISSSTIFIWLGLIMVVWLVLIRGRLERSFSSDDARKVLHKISRGMVSTLIGLSLWYIKTYVIKLIDSSFKMDKFFGRVKDAIVYKFVEQELKKFESGNTIIDDLEREYVRKLHKTVQGEVDAVYMTQLIKKLSTLNQIELTRPKFEEKPKTEANKAMTLTKIQHEHKNEHHKGPPCIDTEKLKKALGDGVPYTEVLSVFGGDKVEKIAELEFREWMIEADEELRNLAMSLQDSNTAIDELNLISEVLVSVIILIVWSLVMGIMTTEVLVFVSSQLLVWSFIFSDTFKTVFEGIIFNFVAHPLDVGDMCIIEEKKMVVEEMGLLSTNFQANGEESGKFEDQKVHYSNSVLAGLRIINLSKTASKLEERRIWTRKKQA